MPQRKQQPSDTRSPIKISNAAYELVRTLAFERRQTMKSVIEQAIERYIKLRNRTKQAA